MQLSYSEDVGWFFEKIAIYWFMEGFGHLEKFWAPTDKKIGPKKIENPFENFIFVAVSKKWFGQKQSYFSLRFLLLVHPIGPCALKRLSDFQAKRISDPKKIEKHVEILIAVSKMCFCRKRKT